MIGIDGPAAAADLVEVGRILKPRGVRGEVFVRPDREGYFPFAQGVRVRVGTGAGARTMEVAHFFLHKGMGVLKLAGLGTFEEASALAGAPLSLPASEVGREPDGFFDAEAVAGFSVEDASRGTVGRVVGVRSGPAYWILDAEGPLGPFEVPSVAGLGVEVREGERAVRCDLPKPWPGLDEKQGSAAGAVGGGEEDGGAR